MKLLQNNSLTRWIGVAATATVVLAGCTRDPFDDEGRRPSDLPRVEMTIGLALPQMVAASPVASTEAADTRAVSTNMEVSDTEAMTVSFGGANTSETENAETVSAPILNPTAFAAAAATRAGETVPTAVEQLIRGLWIVQFDGTSSDSKLAACDYYNGDEIIEDRLVASVAEVSGTMRLYVVANVGETHFEGLSVGTTTLGAFEAMVCEIAPMTISQAATSGLPMVGRYDGTLDELQPEILLQRMVAKVTVTCTTSVPASETFLVRSSQLFSVTKGTAYVKKTVPDGTSGLYPDASQTENFADTPARALTEGLTSVWYVPENLRGVVASITSATDKTAAKAPKGSTAIEVVGYYVKDGTFYDALYRIYLGQNLTSDFNLVRNHVYTVSMTIKGMNVSDSRIESYEIEDLGANGTANCYMAPKAGTSYRFDATVMGNGATTPAFNAPAGGVSAPAITPKALNPISAKVLWETGTEKGVQVPFVELVDGTLLFTTAGVRGANPTEGNALLGAFDSNGTLLWSWHIWSTRYDPETNYDSYASGYDVMQYNLGADATSAVGTVGRVGLFYQWGRKDPMIGPRTTESTGRDFAETANDGKFAWKEELSTRTGAEQIAYAIQNPTTFLYCSAAPWDWVANEKAEARIDNLWGNPNATTSWKNPSIGEKSIYDPCPPGWRVAPANTWAGFTSTGTYTAEATQFNVTDAGFQHGWTFYTGGWKTGATSYYPVPGTRQNSTGYLINNGTNATYRTSSPTAYNEVNMTGIMIDMQTVGMNGAGTANRGGGFSVRCVRDGNPHGTTSDAINLSANGSANCYIVGKAGTDYKFNARVMGNGAVTAPFNITGANTASAPAILPKTLAPASAKVLWETGSVKGGIIKTVTIEDGYVVFTTAGTTGAAVTEGNAVIGVFNAAGTLIWSWHIWSTSYDPDTSYDTYTTHANYGGNQYVMMQHNLGANAKSAIGTVGRFGLFYQWGRKDPLIGARTINSTGTDYAVTVNDSKYPWKIVGNPAASGDAMITNTIQNPTTYYYRTTDNTDWLTSTVGNRRDNLWGNPNPGTTINTSKGVKSIYDPCPPGWQVPPQHIWTGFTTTGASATKPNANIYGEYNVGLSFYVNGTQSGPTAYYPTAGRRIPDITITNTGELEGANVYAYYFTSSPYANNTSSVGRLGFGNSANPTIQPTFNGARQAGMCIRCVKE